MKKKKVLSSLLLAGIVLGYAQTAVASAETVENQTGSGDVSYVGKDPNKPTVDPGQVVDPDDKDGDGGDVEGVTDSKSELSIDVITPLHFGKQEVTMSQKTYNAASAKFTPNIHNDKGEIVGKGTPEERGNFVSITDMRTGEKTPIANNWKLSAKLTQQFSVGSNTLKGAYLTYKNPLRNSNQAGDETTTPWKDNVKLSGQTFKLAFGDAPVEFLKAENGGGKGIFNLQFGKTTGSKYNGPDTAADDTAKSSVTLTVPGGQNLVKDEYKAVITWTIADVA
jgi:hypothetical protein